jgi:hypothetical protein
MAQIEDFPVEPAGPRLRAGITRLSMITGTLAGALVGAACSSAAVSPLGAATGTTSQSGSSGTVAMSDVEILNFALNLEYLEAEFYSVSTTGKTLEQNGCQVSGTGTAGGTTGGAQVTFTDSTTQAIAREIYADEVEHVNLLRSVLGSQAIAKPAINLNGLGAETGSMSQFLMLSRAFEDTGVSAYGGAAPDIVSKTVLQTAAQILAVEAYHASAVRLLIAQMHIPTTAIDSMDVLPPPSGTQYFTDHNGLAVVRTPQQVAAIVKPFFPNGINGPLP